MTSIRWQALGIFLIGLVVFTIGSPDRSLIGFGTQFYLLALEMWQQEPLGCLLVYQWSYFDYPPASTLLIYAFSKMVGSLNTITAVFPTAAASSVTLMMTYLIGVLHSKRWGITSVLFLLFTVIFFVESRNVSVDQYTTAITIISFYLVYSAKKLDRPERVKWIFVFFALGFVLRGLSGFLIPAGVVSIYYLLEKDYKKLLQIIISFVVLLLVCITLMYLFAYKLASLEFANKIVRGDLLGYLQNIHIPQFDILLLNSFTSYVITFPLAILVIIGFYTDRVELPHVDLIWKLVGWVLFVLFAFSMATPLEMRLLLPMAPALALICGYLFEVVHERSFLYVLRNIFVWFCFYFPALSLVAVFFIHFYLPEMTLSFNMIVAILVFLQVATLIMRRRQKFVFALAVIAFIATYTLVAEPVYTELNSVKSESLNKNVSLPAGEF